MRKPSFDQTAGKLRCSREHAAETAEHKHKEKEEEARHSRKMMPYMMGGMGAVLPVMAVVISSPAPLGLRYLQADTEGPENRAFGPLRRRRQ